MNPVGSRRMVLLFGEGANQVALAHRLAHVAPVAGLVDIATHRFAPRTNVLRRKLAGVAGLPVNLAWRWLQRRYARMYDGFPAMPTIVASSANDPEVVDFIQSIRPELVLVSGTNILKKATIERIQRAGACIMNLHTGISPYVKGAPNCTNWCLSIGRPDLIGNTMMWIDAGIDTGNIIATERTPIDGVMNPFDLHLRVMEHAHDLCLRTVKLFMAGVELPNVPQSEIGEGRIYYNREWGVTANALATLGCLRFLARGRPGDIRLIDLPTPNGR